MIDTLILPGLDGSGPAHWQRLWAQADPRAEVVEQDDWARPTLPEWLHRLEARLAQAPGAVLVAHSLGCVLLAHLATRPAAAHVAGALLVAPADIERLAASRPDLADFVERRRARMPFPTILAASRNDPFLAFGQAEALARDYGSALVDLGFAGHVNPASGFGDWSEGRVLADGLRRSAGPAGREAAWRARAARFDHGLGVS